MRYKHFQNSNVDVSELAIGTWGMGELERFGFVKDEGKVTTKGILEARLNAIEAIQAGLQNGINLIDTAPGYGTGAAERLVGEAIQDFDREKVLISTKFSLVPNQGRGENRRVGGGGSYKNIMREVANSMGLMRVKYIDFYFLHWPDPDTDIAETMSALNVLKKRGIIRYIGLSNHSQAQIEAAMEWGQVDVIQPPYSMVAREQEDLMKWAYSKGIDSLTYGSLGSGLLTGAIRQRPNFEGRMDIRGGFYGRLYQEENFNKFLKLLEVMDNIAAAHQKPVAQVAINWSTQQEFVGTALCGMANAKEAIENCSTFDWMLSPEEMAALNKVLEDEQIGKDSFLRR